MRRVCALLGLALSSCSTDTKSTGERADAATDVGAGGSAVGGAGVGGHPGTGGAVGSSGGASSGGSGESSGGAGTGGAKGTAGAASAASGGAGGKGAGGTAGGTAAGVECDAPGLVWRTANKTNYTSYPDPGSEECVKYNGCTWAGQFAACDGKKPEAWVAAHSIVAAFPDFATLSLHDLCLRKGSKKIVVTVLDTCGDADCGGCCTQNKGNADELIDIESYTNDRWGVPDGPIDWADLGPTKGTGCD